MASQMIDECFNARMNALCGRFPLKTFREQFLKTYAEKGIVLIQGKEVDFRDWLVRVGANVIQLPKNSFRSSGTDTDVVRIVIYKD